MSLNVSAFTPVRKDSISSDDSDGKAVIHLPETPFRSQPYAGSSWWNVDASTVHPSPLWSWWGLQSHRLTNLYRYPHFSDVGEDDKPSQSYIGLIAEAILSSQDEKLILSDIYGYILANYPYFRNKGTGWRNSIRHNLSLNDCFIKAGRSQNGKGHFWAINDLYIDDFRRGDFRRKRTYRRPSRGKKARAKLEAMKMKTALETQQANKIERNQREQQNDELDHCQKDLARDDALEPENLNDGITDIKQDVNVNIVQGRGQDDTGKEQLCESFEADDERVFPSSPDWRQEECQQIDVCTTDADEEPSKTPHKPSEERKIDETEMEDPRARRAKAFDMETLLAKDGRHELGFVGEMYPMYYKIMRLGMRNLETMDCYRAPQPYCGHCCSMSFPLEHGELRRPVPAIASYGTVPSMHDECSIDCVE